MESRLSVYGITKDSLLKWHAITKAVSRKLYKAKKTKKHSNYKFKT